jgi:hypothetical protein
MQPCLSACSCCHSFSTQPAVCTGG